MTPFRRLPFDELPDRPRVPHPWYDHPLVRVDVETAHFGRVDVAYKRVGEGPPLLLVHGLMTAGYSWRYVLEPLGRRYTLYIPDLVGSGFTEKPDVPYTPDAVADFIGAFQDRLGITGCAAIGNSLGGYLCMRLALRRPSAMSRLVNLHSPATPLWRMRALRTAMSIPGSYALLSALVHRDPERWVHRNVHYYDETMKSLEECREYADPLRDPAGAKAFGRALYETSAPHEFAAFMGELRRFRAFPIPLRLVYAETDPLVPPQVGSELAAATGAEIVWLKEASHFAHVDQVEGFLRALDGFLA